MPLRPGNQKLGPLIHHWSIPSGVKKICVGASDLCLMLCYAMRGHYNHRNVKEANQTNYEESRRSDFVVLMCAWIRAMFARVVRIHASGEFYSASYVKKWIAIVTRNPTVTFFAYTRSWRNPTILVPLIKLAQLPNMRLWFSCDRETGPPPEVPYVQRAYMSLDDEDQPEFPVDLVFRVQRHTVRKWYNRTLVCPAENGVTATTCSKCQLCFRDKPIPIRSAELQGELISG